MDKNKYSSDMEKEIKQICRELNDGQIAVTQATEKLLDLFSVSNSLQDMIVLKEYYKNIANTYNGGCYNREQVEAIRKIKVLEEKIKVVSGNYC